MQARASHSENRREEGIRKGRPAVGIYEHLTQFAGLPVKDFDPSQGIEDPTGTVYRISHEPPPPPSAGQVVQGLANRIGSLFGRRPGPPPPPPPTPPDPLTVFLDDPAAGEVPALVIGMWGFMPDAKADLDRIVAQLAAGRDRLRSLRALFLGDIIADECEISWLGGTNLAPIFQAYPELEQLWVRGADGLTFGTFSHASLRTLVIQSGGLPGEVTREIGRAHLPALEHLELWLGEENYGGTTTPADLAPILAGQHFPELRTLALRNAEHADEIARAVAQAPLTERLRVLDLSMGTLGDAGAEALLASPAVRRLEKLDLHHHYLSAGVSLRLMELDVEVNLDDKHEVDDEDGEEYRYIAVSE